MRILEEYLPLCLVYLITWIDHQKYLKYLILLFRAHRQYTKYTYMIILLFLYLFQQFRGFCYVKYYGHRAGGKKNEDLGEKNEKGERKMDL